VNTWGIQNKTNEYFYQGYNLGYPGPGPVKTGGFNGTFGLNITPMLPAISCTGLPEDGTRPPYTNTLFNNLAGTCTNTAPPNPPAGMFWQRVVQLNFWGGAFADGAVIPQTRLSVGTAPITLRASWFQPPYQ